MSYFFEKCIIVKDSTNKQFNCFLNSHFLHYLQLLAAELCYRLRREAND